MNNSAIAVEGLSKRFGDVTAVNRVSLTVGRGELFGFLGPNGAGKTTMINMLTGLARPDSGTIHISGVDCSVNPKAAQRLIGVVPDESNLYPELSGFDNLCFCAALYGMGKSERRTHAREFLELFGLSEAAERKFGGYSKGMKRKLTIAAGIIHRPEMLFLDEPTTGIDVAAARQIRQMLAALHGNGTTIFLTTHYIEEAERLCGRIAFIVKGQIIRIDEMKNLLMHETKNYKMILSLSNPGKNLADLLSSEFPDMNFEFLPGSIIRVESPEPVKIGPLVRFFESHGIEVSEARKAAPSLEDIFVRITGIEADVMLKEKEKQGGAG